MSQSMLCGSAFFFQFLQGYWRGALSGAALSTVIFISAFSVFVQLFAQQQADQPAGEIFRKAIIRMHPDGGSPAEIRFPAAGPATVEPLLAPRYQF